MSIINVDVIFLEGVVETLSNLVDFMVPSELSDMEEELDINDVMADMNDAEYYSDGSTASILANMTSEDKTQLAEAVLKLKKKHKEIQEKKSKTVKHFLCQRIHNMFSQTCI